MPESSQQYRTTSTIDFKNDENRKHQAGAVTPSNLNNKRKPSITKEHYSLIVYYIGVAGCTLGLISFILGIATLLMSGKRQNESGVITRVTHFSIDGFTYIAQGIWCGALLMFSGAVAIRTKRSYSGNLYSESAKSGVPTTIICILALGLSCQATHSYTYPIWRIDFISIHSIIAIVCLAGILISIAQVVFSYKINNLSNPSRRNGDENNQQRIQSPTNTTEQSEGHETYSYLAIVGIIEVIAGCTTLVVDLLAFSTIIGNPTSSSLTAFDYTFKGVWGGLFLIITGIFGIYSKFRGPVNVNVNMVMSMVASAISAGVVVISIIAIITGLWSQFSLHVTVAVAGFVAMIVCAVHSMLCCVEICNRLNYMRIKS